MLTAVDGAAIVDGPFVQITPPAADAADQKGKVSASASVLYYEGGLYGPYGNGSLSWWAAEKYSLAFTSLSSGTFAQGNFILWDRGLSLGLVHGLGIRLNTDEGAMIGTAGLFIQSSSARSSVFYGGLRGTAVFNDSERFMELSAGWMKRVSGLQLGPEVRWEINDPRQEEHIVSLSLHLEANF